MAAKPKKDKDKKPWLIYSINEYQAAFSKLQHFSNKTVNTNAALFYARVSTEYDNTSFPFACVKSTGALRVPLDSSGGAQTSKIANQLLSILYNTIQDRYFDIDYANVSLISEWVSSIDFGTSNTHELNSVSPRVRQLLIPSADNNYVSITPVHSSGFSVFLNQCLEAERGQANVLGLSNPIRRKAELGFGGANPQNAGLRVRDMTRALVFEAPAEDSNIKRLYSIHYNGVSLTPPLGLMIKLHELRFNMLKQGNNEALNSSMKSRRLEAYLLREITRTIITRAKSAIKELDASSLFDSSSRYQGNDSVQQGLFNKDIQDSSWIDLLSQRIADNISLFKLNSDVFVPISSSGANSFVPIINKCIRESLND